MATGGRGQAPSCSSSAEVAQDGSAWLEAALGGFAERAACKVQALTAGGRERRWMKMLFALQEQQKGQNTTDRCRPGDAMGATRS